MRLTMSSRGSRAAVVGHRLAVRHHPGERGHRVLGVLRGAGVVGAEQRVAPVEDQVTVLARHAEEIREDAQRHLGGHGGHEVELAVADLGEDLVAR